MLITYVILEYTAVPAQNAERQERPRTSSPNPKPDARNAPRSPHKRHISPPILIPPQPSTRRATELYTAVQLPPPFYIYKYPRYILYILKIYNICVYIMCIYISIGIYKISAAKKRANRTQKEYTQPPQSNTTKKRENTAKRSKDTPNTTHR